MPKQPRATLGLIGALVPFALVCAVPMATLAQLPSRPGSSFQGRGIAQGAVFNRGRNANVALTLDGENFGLEMTEIVPSNTRGQTPGRVQYRGAITRRTDEATPNSFSLFTRVRSFDSSANLRIITNTTGTCRIEIFDGRVIASSCSTIADNSETDFLGLEQF